MITEPERVMRNTVANVMIITIITRKAPAAAVAVTSTDL